jgi:hypothetical protein
MGPRPPDFEEGILKQSPTYQRWLLMESGNSLRYACRTFVKGREEDDERLLRRLMIARRNNIRDHELLKQARRKRPAAAQRKSSDDGSVVENNEPENIASAVVDAADKDDDGEHSMTSDPASSMLHENHDDGIRVLTMPTLASSPCKWPSDNNKRRSSTSLSDLQIEQEMDVPAVEATRSYKTWKSLQEGQEFSYNQKYTKGKDGHDWLLKKNIWRRMRYRRENRKMVETLKGQGLLTMPVTQNPYPVETTSGDKVDESSLTWNRAGKNGFDDHGDGEEDVEEDHMQHEPIHVDVTSHAAALAASALDHEHHHHDLSGLAADDDAIAAAVAAGESFGKSQQQNMDDNDDSLVHNPLEMDDDAAATAAKLAEAGQLYGARIAGGDDDVAEV